MKHVVVHHLHVKCKDCFFTVFHRSDYVTVGELRRMLKEIEQYMESKHEKKFRSVEI